LVADAKFLSIGAQNIHWEEKGAWTGQVSVLQVSPFVRWSIVGHSEQRLLTGESDQEVQRKIDLLLKHGLSPVICVGETAEEQSGGATVAKVTAQMQVILQKLTRTSLNKIAIAYEPIWAIGSGRTHEPNEMAGIMLLIRRVVAERFDAAAAEKVRILYGGSVTSRNVGVFVAEPGVDGVLVGGASVHPAQFADIVAAVDAASHT
jgi:triosephosphate isomerase